MYLRNILEKSKGKTPEKILDEIRSFYVDAGEAFRQGKISEKEFYEVTNPTHIYNDLFGMNHHIILNEHVLRIHPEFIACYREWKETGKVEEEEWMSSCITHLGSITESYEWIFHVIDVLKLPIEYFKSPVHDFKGECPDVGYESFSGPDMPDKSWIVLKASIVDFYKLTTDPRPEGKSFTLHLYDGTAVDMTVDRFIDKGELFSEYECHGTVSGYISEEEKFRIQYSLCGGYRIFIRERSYTSHMVFGTDGISPIPGERWDEYNMAIFSHYYRLEAEYKILRIPFMMGFGEGIKKNDAMADNVVSIFSARKNRD